MRKHTRALLGLAALIAVGSCVSSDSSTGIDEATIPAGIVVQPSVVVSAANETAQPIDRIRAVTARTPSNIVLADTTFSVDPDAASWEVTLGVPLTESPIDAVVFLYLLNGGTGGEATVEYSGKTDPVTLSRGETAAAPEFPLVRGPLANLFVTSLGTTAPDAQIIEGETVPLLAEPESSSASTARPLVFWTSLDSTIIRVDSATALAVAPGVASIVASAGLLADTFEVEVIIPPVDSVAVSPDSVDVIIGQSRTFTADLFDFRDRPLSGRDVLWVIGDTAIATIDSLSGVVTTRVLGTTTVTATSEGVSGSATLVVVPVPVASVQVTPDTAAVRVGQATSFTFATFDSIGGALTGRSATWTTANASVATVDASGTVTGVAAGITTVIATSEGASDEAVVVVSLVPVDSVLASPDSIEIRVGGTFTYTAETFDSIGGALANRSIEWGSSDVNVAVIDEGTGVVTGIGAGSTVITATSEGITNDAIITVSIVPVDSVLVSPDSVEVGLGGETQYSVELFDSIGGALTGRSVLWETTDSTVATIDDTGRLTGVGLGTATVRATAEGLSDDAVVVVSTAPILTTWTAAVSPNWSDAGNWDNGVPSGSLSALVPSGTPAPVVSSASTVLGLTVEDGASVNLQADLTATGDVSAQGLVGGAGTLLKTGSGTTIEGIFQTLSTTDSITASSDFNVEGAFTAGGPGSGGGNLVSMNGFNASVGELIVGPTGFGGIRFAGGDTLLVFGDARFAGGDATTRYSAGALVLEGALIEDGASLQEYNATGTHTTIFQGSTDQDVEKSNPTTSTFQNVVVDKSGGVLYMQTDAVVDGSLTVAQGSVWTGSTLTLNGSLDVQDGAALIAEGTVDMSSASLTEFSGDLAPGDVVGSTVGEMVVSVPAGGFIQGVSSEFVFGVAGTVPGTQHDVLRFDGAVSLDGDLVVETIDLYEVNAGERYAIMTYASRTGDFANVTLPTIAGITLDTLWVEGGAIDTLVIAATADGGGAQNLATWASPASGNWSNPANWFGNQVPQAGDSVVIAATGTYAITIDQAVDVSNLIVGASASDITIVHAANTLTVTDTLVVGEGARYALNGTGTLTGTGDIVVTEGTFDWFGGTLSGAAALIAESLGGIWINGSATKTLDTRDIVVDGSLLWSGDGDVDHSGSPLFDIGVGAEFTIDADAAMSGAPRAFIQNDGIIRANSSGTAVLLNFELTSTDSVIAESGSLTISDFEGTSSSTGAFFAADGAYLGIPSGTVDAASSIAGEGTIALSDGFADLTIDADVDVDTLTTVGAQTITINGSYLVGTTAMTSAGVDLIVNSPDTAFSDVTILGSLTTLGGSAPFVFLDTLIVFNGDMTGTGTAILDVDGYAQIGASAVDRPFRAEGVIDILDGTWDVGADFFLDTLGFLQGDGGILDLADATVSGWFGDISPGNGFPGELDIVMPAGGLTMDEIAITYLDIEGYTPGFDYDVMTITGDVTIDGDLVLDTLGFTPLPYDTFPMLVVNGTRSGDFATLSNPELGQIDLTAEWRSGVSADTLFVVADPFPMAFATDRFGGDKDILLQNEAGDSTVLLTTSLDDEYDPDWSPDGLELVYTRLVSLFDEEQIFRMSYDGTGAVQLTSTNESLDPAWSPAGDSIVFTRYVFGVSEDVWAMEADGSGQVELTNTGLDYGPDWNPQGGEIVFTSFRDEANEKIWIMDSDGGNQQALTTVPGYDDYAPQWSPDGTKIVFVSTRDDLNGDIYIMDADGLNPVRITNDSGSDYDPTFSADGTLIYFTSERDGDAEIWVRNADGTGLPTQVTDNVDFDGYPTIRR